MSRPATKGVPSVNPLRPGTAAWHRCSRQGTAPGCDQPASRALGGAQIARRRPKPNALPASAMH